MAANKKKGPFSPIDQYADYLGALEGNEFQDHVCFRLGRRFTDFQPVPANPGGDGGVDGLSHGLTQGYCCYGPERAHHHTSAELASAVIKKFRNDLRKLFEVKKKGKGWTDDPSSTLPVIFENGAKLRTVYLVCSWMEHNTIVGKLHAAFAEYKASSMLRFVEPDCTMTIWDAKQFAGSWGVDEGLQVLIAHSELAARVAAKADTLPLPTSADFDDKFAWLQASVPDSAKHIGQIAERLRASWRVALAFDYDLSSTAPTLHEAYERAQEAADGDAAFIQIDPVLSVVQKILKLREKFEQRLAHPFQEHYGTVMTSVSDGELGRRIGECTVDWRP
jgi:hypothetical protein